MDATGKITQEKHVIVGSGHTGIAKGYVRSIRVVVMSNASLIAIHTNINSHAPPGDCRNLQY